MKKWKVILGVSLVVISVFCFTEILLFLNSVPTHEKVERVIAIPRGTPFIKIAKHLKEQGVITHEIKFYVLARFKRSIRKIKAGEYMLYTNMMPTDVLDTLVSGRTFLHRVTVPEGYNVYQVAQVIERAGLLTQQEFITAAQDSVLVDEIDAAGPTFEGYLFPESYFFSKPIDAKNIIQTMVTHFRDNYTEEIAFQAKQLGLSKREVVTLASMIEKETGVPEERRLISAVFHNRLKQKMKFQSDPTVIYGLWGTFLGNLSKRHLLTPSPYNTYLLPGFPVGPIANPGRASLEAAVNPAPVSYLFFVSKNDGSHVFSTTYREHVNAVNRYQKKAP